MKWEYRVVYCDKDTLKLQEKANEMGKNGWEMISAITNIGQGNTSWGSSISESVGIYMFFKRPVADGK